MNKREVINELTRRLVSKVHPYSIILFGSVAKEEDRDHSDIDVLVVWDGARNLPNVQRRIRLRDAIGDIDSPMDLLTCTTEEFRHALADPNSFTSQIVREGKVIYGRLN